MLVTVEDGRAIEVRGAPDHPPTAGTLCTKVARYLERTYSDERVRYPMRRVGNKGEGRFERISWDDALATIAEKFGAIAASTDGPQAIVPYSYAGTMGLLQYGSMDRRFFHRLGASLLDRTICATAGKAGWVATIGAAMGTDVEQFEDSRLILIWGSNPVTSNLHLWTRVQEAKRRGAKVVAIDPYRSQTAEKCHEHVALLPGTDAALALGMMHVLIADDLVDHDYIARYTIGFDGLRERAADYPPERVAQICGISAETVTRLARAYGTTRPAVIRVNYGMQRHAGGGNAIRAVACLPALVGAWRDPAGGALLSSSGTYPVDVAALERPDLIRGTPRTINMSVIGNALLDEDAPPIRAIYVYNSNPVAVAPESSKVVTGFAREDLFCVVHEIFHTDTADYADILLPSTTFLEHTDLYRAYGHYHVQLARPVVDAPGEARSNVEVFRDLALRMGFDDQCFRDSEDIMIRSLLNSGHKFLEGITLDRLNTEHSIRLNISEPGTPFLPFSEGGFGTPSGKCEFGAETLDYAPPQESRFGDASLQRRYPLELISSKNDDSMNSTFGNRPHVDTATSLLHLNQTDAAKRGIQSGDRVRVYNDRGSLTLRADVNGVVQPGVARAPSVRWNKRSEDASSVNVLTSDRLTDIGGGPTFYSCLVEVERCGD